MPHKTLKSKKKVEIIRRFFTKTQTIKNCEKRSEPVEITCNTRMTRLAKYSLVGYKQILSS